MSEGVQVNEWGERRDSDRDDAKADLAALIVRAWRRRWWVIASVAGFTIALGTLALVMTPVYRASTVLVAANHSSLTGALTSALGSLGGLASLAGIDLNAGGNKSDEVLAVLKSRQFIEAFIRDENLLPVLYADEWDAAAGTWKQGEQPRSMAQAHKYFVRKVMDVERDKASGLITLSIDWKDAALATAWANELVDRLNAEMRVRALDEADKSLGFLEQETKRTTLVGMQSAIARLMESQLNQRMVANVTAEFALRVVDRAMVPDPRDPIRPRTFLMVAGGIVLGLTIGLFLVWFIPERHTASRSKGARAQA